MAEKFIMVNSGIGVVEDAEGVQVMYTASKISLFIPPLKSEWIKNYPDSQIGSGPPNF